MPDDGPQHPFEDDARRHAAWACEDVEPTNLIAPWPDEQVPSRMEVLAAFAAAAGGPVDIVEDLGEHSADFEWACLVRIPQFDRPVAVWVEPARPMSAAEREVLGGWSCTWVLGVEAVLEAVDPLRDYTGLMRLMMRGVPDAPAILDVTTTRWTARTALDGMFEHPDVEPPADVLWVVEARRAPPDRGGDVWLRTRGLARCGRPELEMLGVPGNDADAAASVLNGMASMLFEAEPPDPAARWSIGHDLHVALLPWADVGSQFAALIGGNPADRASAPGTDDGPSAVVVDVDADGSVHPDAWAPRVVRCVATEECGLYWTERATRRQADLARSGWEQFAMAWAAMRLAGATEGDDPPAVFGLKAGCAVPGRPELNHEHLWFRVHGFDGDTVDGELVNDPVHEVGLARGARTAIERADVTDWLVVTSDGSFGPAEVDRMWASVDGIRAHADAAPAAMNGTDAGPPGMGGGSPVTRAPGDDADAEAGQSGAPAPAREPADDATADRDAARAPTPRRDGPRP